MATTELDTSHPSSGEEQVSSEESEAESEPDNTPPPPPSRKTLATPNSSSESDAGKADPNIKPLASKPMDDTPLKKSRSKNPTSRYSPPPMKLVTRKRPAPAPDAESKSQRATVKVVVAVAAPDVDKQKKPLQRSWTEDEEIELIKGMIDYLEKKGKDPISDLNDFHAFVINSLNVDVNIRRLADKVRRIKTKFMNNIGKIEKEGNVRSFSKPHERIMYEFSETLWGIKTNQTQMNPKSVVLDKKNVNGGWLEFPITDEEIMKKGLELVSDPKKVELEEKWTNLKVQQLEHFLKKLEFMQEQTKLVLNAIKKSAAN